MRDYKKKNILALIIFLIGMAVFVLYLCREYVFPKGSMLASLNIGGGNKSTGTKVLESIVVFIIAGMVINLCKFIISLIINVKDNRVKTIIFLFGNIINYVVAIASLLVILSIFGVETKTLVTGAGLVTLIVGLGCQSLVSDIVSGLFIIFEGEFRIGDIVSVGGWCGKIESIGLRTTKIVDAYDNMKIINNSAVRDVIINTKYLSYAICKITIDYATDIKSVEKLIMENAELFKNEIPAIEEGPIFKGISTLNGVSMQIKIVAKCKEEFRGQTERDLNRVIKMLFDKYEVKIK